MSSPATAAPAGEFPLSAQQEFLWEGARFRSFGQPIASRGNPSIAVELAGELDLGRFRHALELMIRRHESLRTTLTDVGPAPLQRVAEDLEPPMAYVDLADSVPEGRRLQAARALVAGDRGGEFHLVEGPLWSCLVVRIAPDLHVLALSFSHLIIDGVSLISFLDQLGRLYDGEELPPLKQQYRHFAEESRRPAPDLEARLDHWRRHLLPLPGRLSFPTDYSAVPPALISFAEEDFRSPLTAPRLRELSVLNSATPFILNLAAYAAVLARTGGAERVVIGSSVARLDLKADDDQLGYYLDNIFVPVRVRPKDTVGELVGQVRESVAAAQRNIVPYTALAAALKPDFEESRPWPGIHLYDAWVRGRVFEAATDTAAPASFGSTTVKLFSAPGGSAPRAVTDPRHQEAYSRYYLPSLYLNDAAGSNGYLEYNRAVFARDTVRRLAADQQAFVARLADPRARVDEVWHAVKGTTEGKRTLS
ncbi:condensation domain-containing protein [Kitasatospora sp. NPDC004799]|uniref:condensation domain-containing protein n=1 Tax=Kitasatospora sp. NPDC004799 TaxID=3154460 RepID=UPI0033B3DA9A